MDNDLEWLFEEVYKIKRESPNEKIHFLSDWDSEAQDTKEFNLLLNEAYSNAARKSHNYLFSFEQFELKNQVLKLIQDLFFLSVPESCITITPNATLSIHLVLLGLNKLNIKRFLVFSPVYFSTLHSLGNIEGHIFYYHLLDEDNYCIDLDTVEKFIKEQSLQAIILTDPIYSTGMEIDDSFYASLSELCNKYNIYLLIDYSLGGLIWDETHNFVLNFRKLKILLSCRKFVFIDSLPKRLLLNGIKFSIVFGDENIINKIDLMAEGVYGGLNNIQLDLLKLLYSKDNQNVLTDVCKRNVDSIRNNYKIVKTLLKNSDFEILETNSGFFSIINHQRHKLKDVNTKTISLELLKNEKILAMTTNIFSFYQDNKLGFRINLSKKNDELTIPISKCIRIPFTIFNYG